MILSGGHVDGFMQERRNSIANALELRLSCTNSSMFSQASAWSDENQYEIYVPFFPDPLSNLKDLFRSSRIWWGVPCSALRPLACLESVW